jgi:hydroxypyruvate isomerase
MAGLVSASVRSEARATFIANLRWACESARAQGVTVLIEALNPRDAPNYLFSTQAEANAIRMEVGASNLRLQLDLYHTQIVEGDLSDKIRRYLPHVGHIQIAGVPGRHEPDIGEINYAWIFRLLDDFLRRLRGPSIARRTARRLGSCYRLLDSRPADAEASSDD